jgi:hypothetical protein
MKLRNLIEALNLTVKTGENLLERDVTGGYAGDLLSDVLAHSRPGNIWITLHTHPNIVAVASSRELSGIIIVHGRTPEEATLQKAAEENLPIMISDLSTYHVACRLCELGVR